MSPQGLAVDKQTDCLTDRNSLAGIDAWLRAAVCNA